MAETLRRIVEIAVLPRFVSPHLPRNRLCLGDRSYAAQLTLDVHFDVRVPVARQRFSLFFSLGLSVCLSIFSSMHQKCGTTDASPGDPILFHFRPAFRPMVAVALEKLQAEHGVS